MALPLLAAIPTAVQAGTGIYQAIKGRQLANSTARPDYSIPQEMLDMMTDSEVQALRGLPAEQRQQYLDNVMRAQQASLEAMGDRKAGLAGLAGVQQQATDAYRNMLSMDSQARMDAEQRLQGVRGTMADYKDKQFQVNEMQPYQNTMQAAEAMKGAGLQNIMGGVMAGSQMGLDYARYRDLLKSLKASDLSPTAQVGGSPTPGNTIPVLPKGMNPLQFDTPAPTGYTDFNAVRSLTSIPRSLGNAQTPF